MSFCFLALSSLDDLHYVHALQDLVDKVGGLASGVGRITVKDCCGDREHLRRTIIHVTMRQFTHDGQTPHTCLTIPFNLT
jgi:hypothetical protein